MTYKVSSTAQLSLRYLFNEWLQFPAIPRTWFWSSFLLILDPKSPLKCSLPEFLTSSFFLLCYSPVSSKLNCSTPTHLSRSYSNDNSEVLTTPPAAFFLCDSTALYATRHLSHCVLPVTVPFSLPYTIQFLWIWKLVYHFAFGSQFTWHLEVLLTSVWMNGS